MKDALVERLDTKPTIKFKCDIPGYEIGQPVKKASDIRPDWLANQLKLADTNDTPKFYACPGMHDFYRAGYIIPAWEDFEIIVTKEEATINIGKSPTFVCKPFERMQYSVVDGCANIDQDIKPHALKLPCPWKVFTKPGYSAFVLPALFHSPFLRELFLYPGINDYDAYHTINVMFSPLNEMHIKIYAGTPMLQVIPYKRENHTCEVGPITQTEHGQAEFTYRTGAPNFYRKFIHKKKKYDLTYVK
jgi:hypothetical protein